MNKKKQGYGEFENVLLTDEEMQKLKDRFPTTYERKIEDASIYLAAKGDKYKSHYAMLLMWDRMDTKRTGCQIPRKKYDHEY